MVIDGPRYCVYYKGMTNNNTHERKAEKMTDKTTKQTVIDLAFGAADKMRAAEKKPSLFRAARENYEANHEAAVQLGYEADFERLYTAHMLASCVGSQLARNFLSRD